MRRVRNIIFINLWTTVLLLFELDTKFDISRKNSFQNKWNPPMFQLFFASGLFLFTILRIMCNLSPHFFNSLYAKIVQFQLQNPPFKLLSFSCRFIYLNCSVSAAVSSKHGKLSYEHTVYQRQKKKRNLINWLFRWL